MLYKPRSLSVYYQIKISLISTYLAAMVLYVHGYYIEAKLFPVSNAITSTIERFAYRAINPTYFAISGFLFFLGVSKIADCLPKMRKRVSTLLIPFVLWNAIAIIEYLIFSKLPGTRVFLHRDIITHFHSFDSAFSYFFVRPASFHLWFLRDLIAYVAVSPLLYWLIRRYSWYVAVVLLAVTPPFMLWLDLNHLEIAFFVLGGTIAQRSSLEAVRRYLTRPLTLCAALIYLSFTIFWPFFLPKNALVEGYLALLFSCCGMVAVWRGYDWLIHTKTVEQTHLLLSLANYSFFIYLFHEPILFIIMKLGLRLFGIGGISLTLLYLINPLVIIVLGVVIAKATKSCFPSFYFNLVGGRTTRHQTQQAA